MRITADIIEEDSCCTVKDHTKNVGATETMMQETERHEVTERLRGLNLSDVPLLPYQISYSHPSCASGSSKTVMDELQKVEESPPLWLQQYMTKMKNDIKKEVLDELLNITPEFKQMQVSESKIAEKHCIMGKDENSLQCQVEVIHTGIYCDNCDQLIHGIRYKCGNCSDFDLCQECESLPNVHSRNHIFLKIRYPIALKLYQKQKWQELMSPLPMKPARHSDVYSKNQSKKLYEAKFLCDETVPDSTIIPPSTRFVKSWKVMNSGTRVWTHATKLHLIQGSADLVPISQKVDVPHLKPGEEGIVSVLFTSPPLPGVYRSHWNFCHKSRPFGHIVWCHIIVKEIPEDLSIKHPNIDDISDKIVNKQVEVSNIAQVLTAVKEDHEEDNMVPRKLVVNSHTATPNNTPFALTPPKSPDHESLAKSVCEIASEKSFQSQQNNDTDNEDDECSVVSISSSDSETEFVVIPMPACFNLSEFYVSQQLGIPQNLIEKTTNTVVFNSEEPKEASVIKNVARKSTPVSQETGVPELSENTVENLIDCKKTVNISHLPDGGSTSEISIIESESSTATSTVENATQTLDSINVTVSTDLSNPGEYEKIEVLLRTDLSREIVIPNFDAGEKSAVTEQTNIPGNVTFPKFPVEGVTGEIYDRPTSTNVNTEERTVQVLPEGLVIGALSAAASVYNTAKAVISTIQQPKTENGECLSQPLPRIPQIPPDYTSANRLESLNPMQQLIEMGFCNRPQNEALLKKHNNDVASVVAELVNLNDNDWYASRHIPPTPPGFLD